MNHSAVKKALIDKYKYEPLTGVFSNIKTGRVAKPVMDSGYVRLSVLIQGKQKNVRAHRAAYLINHNTMPVIVDHINGDRMDNRIANLRPATRSQNGCNQKVVTTSSSGYRGVYKSGCKWGARIRSGRPTLYIGLYDDAETAAAAYDLAAKELHGEFATINGVNIPSGLSIDTKPRHHRSLRSRRASDLVDRIRARFYICGESDEIKYKLSNTDIKRKSKTPRRLKQPCDNKNGKVNVLGIGVKVDHLRHVLLNGKFPDKTPKQDRCRHLDLSKADDRFILVCDLLSIVDYDKETGLFKKSGKIIGGVNSQGYKCFNHAGKLLSSHRMAYLLTYNEWPDVVDHINGDRADNRISNLRAATHKQNSQNTKAIGGLSKYKGVCYRSDRSKWVAGIDGKRIGSFNTEAEAAKAYDDQAQINHGEFAKLNFPNE